jgi:hypothetical protein
MALRRKALAAFTSRFRLGRKSTVHAPRAAHRPGKPLPPLLELRRVVLLPAHDRGVGHGDATFTHHGDQISIAELINSRTNGRTGPQSPGRNVDRRTIPLPIEIVPSVYHPRFIAGLHQNRLRDLAADASAGDELGRPRGRSVPLLTPLVPVQPSRAEYALLALQSICKSQ